MIYVKTRREFWNARQAFGKFLGTALLLGTAAALSAEAFQGNSKWLAATAGVLAVSTLIKLAFELRIFKHLVHPETPTQSPLNKTARLLAGELNGFLRARIALGMIGGLLLPIIALAQTAEGLAIAPWLAVAAFALCLAGEFFERYLFFTAVVSQKMPGGLAS
jgi:DMSO reductase anchor subunit